MKKQLFLVFYYCILFLLPVSSAQQGQAKLDEAFRCYQKIVSSGQESVRQQNYGLAINQFWAAYTCNYKAGDAQLAKLIGQAVKALELAKEKAEQAEVLAKESEQLALIAKEQAIVNEKKAEQEKREKEEALLRAEKNGRQAEASRLSILAENALREGRKKEAVWLAFAGLKLAEPSTSANARKVFGQTVRDSFAQVLLAATPSAPIESIKILPQHKGILVQANRQAYLIPKTKELAHSFRPNFIAPLKTACSPYGDFLCTWSNSNSLQLWDLRGQLIEEYEQHHAAILSCKFSSDKKYLASGARDHQVVLYQIPNTIPIVLKGHNGNIYDLKFSDKQQLLSRSSDGSVRVWNSDGSLVKQLGGTEIYISDAIFSSGGEQVITASATGVIKAWDLNTDSQAIAVYPVDSSTIIEVIALSEEKILFRSLHQVGILSLKKQTTTPIYQGTPSGITLNHQKTEI